MSKFIVARVEGAAPVVDAVLTIECSVPPTASELEANRTASGAYAEAVKRCGSRVLKL
jgi:hypothetical protein